MSDFTGAGRPYRVQAESTCPKTASNRTYSGWVKLRSNRRVDSSTLYVFTDGSSHGSFAAVIVRAGQEPEIHGGFQDPTSTRNVGAELNGALLAVQKLPRGASAVIVSDYLGVAAWITGNWKIKDPEVQRKIDAIKQEIFQKGLVLSYVHHRGHQRLEEGDDFSKFNDMADRHCGRVLKDRAP